MIRIPEYGELHVVSDLHLGGETPGRQIFDQADQFEQMIDLLLSVSDERKQALLINGDLVDFLAETNAVYFDPMGAADKLRRIFEDPSFVRVWGALKKFVKKPNRTLIITLGNHDLELALPWVRVQLVQMLCDGNDEARARIVLAFEEGGYRCAVGSADVLCVHGNEVDPWNVTDFEQLRRMGQNSLRGAEVEEWTPNGGTKLVIDVMNGLKRKHPFIDLLKPEEGGVIPTLLVLDPEAAAKIGGAVPAWLRSRWDQVKMAAGFLDEDEGVAIAEISKRQKKPVEFLGEMVSDTFGQPTMDLQELLQRTEQRMRAGTTPMQLLGSAHRSEFLGVFGALRNLLLRKGKSEVLREALDKLSKDLSFQFQTTDDTYQQIDRKISSNIDFIVTGHTHLERALPRANGGGYYYNSGTWVRLIQLTAQWLGTANGFLPAFNAFEAAQMTALDALPGLVLRRPAVVSFWADDQGTHGELRHVGPGGFVPMGGSKYTIKRNTP